MLDDVFESLLESLDLGRLSRSAQRIWRALFGLLGTLLGIAGIVHAVAGLDGSLHFRLAAAAIFVSMSAFCLLNVALARPVSWPWKAFAGSFVLLFVVRIVLGP